MRPYYATSEASADNAHETVVTQDSCRRERNVLIERCCELKLRIETRLRTQFPYRNAAANAICLLKRGSDLNLLVQTRLQFQCAHEDAVANSPCASKTWVRFGS